MAESLSQESESSSPTTFTPSVIPTDSRIRFAKAGRDDDENANRLAQARQDLPYTHRDAHAPKPYRPDDLYEMLPNPFRAICGRAVFELDSQDIETQKIGINRMKLNVAVASDKKYLPGSPTQGFFERSGRMKFSSPPQKDVITARFMASVINNICERIPVVMSEIDHTLMHFITSTAERHAGNASHKLPTVNVCPPSDGETAGVECHILYNYCGSVPNTPSGYRATPSTFEMVSCSLIPLSLIPNGPAPDTLSAFLLPAQTRLPSVASVGSSKDVMGRWCRTLSASHFPKSPKGQPQKRFLPSCYPLSPNCHPRRA